MDAVTILSLQAPGTELTLQPDLFVLTDGIEESICRLVGERPLADSGKVKVFIDHETPCGSEKVGDRQRELIDFACRRCCSLSNGYGVSYELMLNGSVLPGQLIVHCGDHGGIYAAGGAVALSLSPEEMAEALCTGSVTLTVPEKFSLIVSGALPEGAAGKDAVLSLLPALSGAKDKLLILDDSAAGWDSAQKRSFCQLLSCCGCLSVLPGKAGTADAAMDLSSVVPMVSGPNDFTLARKAAGCGELRPTSVFIGGCSQGRIEDIRSAAAVIKGRHIARGVRALAAFASTDAYIAAAEEGLIEKLLDAGVMVMNQGCSGCYARSQGLVDGKDLVLSAGSRACPNCNGEGLAQTYLCSAATAMESAIAGYVRPADI